MSQPFISVCVPVYNGMPFIKECVESVLAQDYEAMHLYVSENCSTDGTREYLADLDHPRLTVLLADEHVPMAPNVNRAMAMAKPDGWSMMLSADDVLLAGALTAIAEEMSDSIDLIFAQTQTSADGALRTASKAHFDPPNGAIDEFEHFLVANPFPVNINATFFRNQPVVFSENVGLVFDLDLLLKESRSGARGYWSKKQVISYREHDGAASADRERMWRESLSVYRKHTTETTRPDLYRARIKKLLFWLVAFLSKSSKPAVARAVVRENAAHLPMFLRFALFVIGSVPPLGRFIYKAREARSS